MSRPVQTILPFAIPQDDTVVVILSRTPETALLTPADVASAMDVSMSLVNGWLESGALPSITIGTGDKRTHRRISRTTFERFLRLRTSGVTP